MAKLINHSRIDIPLPAGHVIPAHGYLDCTNDIIRGDNFTVLQGLILSKSVGVEYDAEPDVVATQYTAESMMPLLIPDLAAEAASDEVASESAHEIVKQSVNFGIRTRK